MNLEYKNNRQAYYLRSSRAAWWAAGMCGVLGAISLAEGRFDQGFGGLCFAVAALLLVWGLDYHRRLRPTDTTTPLA
jgi:hypothetical protein